VFLCNDSVGIYGISLIPRLITCVPPNDLYFISVSTIGGSVNFPYNDLLNPSVLLSVDLLRIRGVSTHIKGHWLPALRFSPTHPKSTLLNLPFPTSPFQRPHPITSGTYRDRNTFDWLYLITLLADKMLFKWTAILPFVSIAAAAGSRLEYLQQNELCTDNKACEQQCYKGTWHIMTSDGSSYMACRLSDATTYSVVQCGAFTDHICPDHRGQVCSGGCILAQPYQAGYERDCDNYHSRATIKASGLSYEAAYTDAMCDAWNGPSAPRFFVLFIVIYYVFHTFFEHCVCI
jgi:hypothetical protein